MGSITTSNTGIYKWVGAERTDAMQGNQTESQYGALHEHTFDSGIVIEELGSGLSGYTLSNRTNDTEHETVNKIDFEDAAFIVYGKLVVFAPVEVSIERTDTGKVAHIEVVD